MNAPALVESFEMESLRIYENIFLSFELYVYMYICICVYMHICKYVYINMYICIYLCVYTFMHIYIYVYLYQFHEVFDCVCKGPPFFRHILKLGMHTKKHDPQSNWQSRSGNRDPLWWSCAKRGKTGFKCADVSCPISSFGRQKIKITAAHLLFVCLSAALFKSFDCRRNIHISKCLDQ